MSCGRTHRSVSPISPPPPLPRPDRRRCPRVPVKPAEVGHDVGHCRGDAGLLITDSNIAASTPAKTEATRTLASLTAWLRSGATISESGTRFAFNGIPFPSRDDRGAVLVHGMIPRPRQRQVRARTIGHCAKPAGLRSQPKRAWMPSRNTGEFCSRTTRQVADNMAGSANYGDGRGAERHAAIHPKNL